MRLQIFHLYGYSADNNMFKVSNVSNRAKCKICLTQFQVMFDFYTPWKEKTAGFLTFLGGIEVEH